MAYSKRDIECAFPGGKWSNGEYLIKSPLRPEERTASFRINPEKASYFDFGSGQGGKLSELFALTGQDDPFHGDGGASASPRSREAEEKILKRQAAINLWEAAGDAAGHPYLLHKEVEAYGARRSKTGAIWKDGQLKELTGDFLVIPAYGPDGSMVGIEQIPPAGKPKYDLGEKGVYVLGEYRASVPLLVAEGFSTAASLKKITGWNVACAFGTGNIRRAVENLRRQFTGDIIVTPDTGAEDYSDVADVVEIPGEHPKNTDWNDLVSALGVEQTKDLFREAWAKTRKMKKPETPQEEERPKNGITLLRGDQIQYIAREHLVKGLIQQNSLNVVFGISGCAKTFFCVDMALSIASGQAFLGRPTKEGPVIYVCSEGADELAKRLDAWDLNKASRDVSYKNIPFYYVPHAVILPREKQREALVSSVMEKVENELGGVLPVAIFIDTLARCSEGDENSNEDMSTFVAAADDLKARLGNPAVTILHHTPKSNPEDMRGASALRGALNTSICLALRGTGTPEEQSILMRCDKQKDLPIFPDQALARVQVKLPYTNFYGEPETSCIIEEREKTPDMVKPLTDNEQQAYNAFNKAAIETGVLDDAGRFMGVSRDSWREFFHIEYTGEAEDSTRRSAFKRGIDGLIKRGKIKKVDEFLFRLDGPTAELLESEFARKIKQSGRCSVAERCNALRATESLNPEVVGVALRCTTLGGATCNAQRKGEEVEENAVYTPSPRGYSVSELAALGGVTVEALREELFRWEECGRVSLDGDKIILLAGTSYPGQDDQEPSEEEDEPPVSAPKGPPKLPAAPPERRHIGMKDVTLSDAETWAAGVPGLVQRLKAQAVREHDPVMERSARDLYESLVRIEYAGHLQKELDGEASGEDHIPDAGKKASPGQEGGVPGQEGGQGSLLFPPDEPPAPATPPKENPFLKEEGHSSPRGEDRSGPPPGWLESQPEEVQVEYQAKLKRLRGVSMPDYEAVALLRTWEEFKGNSR